MTQEEYNEIINVITERPTSVKIGGRFFTIAPLSLGKTLMMQRYAQMLDINQKHLAVNPLAALIETCSKCKEIVTRLVAIYITNNKYDILNDEYINNTSAFVGESLDSSDLAVILQMYLNRPKISRYTKLLGIDAEKERLRKINKAKDDSSSIQIGGVSLFGTLIDAACERYKWTYDYVVWGISYDALQLTLADAIQSVYLSDKERKRAKVSTDGINLSGDSQANIDIIKNLIRE